MEPSTRRERLEQLLRLAQTYRGWHRKQLAKALGRDTTKLVPESGLPKLDLLMDLAKVIDWSIEDVAHYLWVDDSTTPVSELDKAELNQLADASKSAHSEGRYAEAVELAQRAYACADSGEDRAIACTREASAWDGLGRYSKAMIATKRGLEEHAVSNDRRLLLQVNLAIEYYTLWQLVEANAIAHCLVQCYESAPPTNRANRVVQAFALYVRGHSNRRMIATEEDLVLQRARQAKRDLLLSGELFRELADEFDADWYNGVANTCTGGLIEVDVTLGRRDAKEALETYVDGLNAVVDPTNAPVGDWLESYGWWCIFGCNVCLRHLSDAREMQHYLALFTNKADEIANRLDNWSIRERVFAMDLARRERFADWTGVESDWSIDKNDVRMIAGTMGRFPNFHGTGWRILHSAKVVAGG